MISYKMKFRFKQSSGVAKKANSVQFHNRDHNLFPGIILRHTIEYFSFALHQTKTLKDILRGDLCKSGPGHFASEKSFTSNFAQ